MNNVHFRGYRNVVVLYSSNTRYNQTVCNRDFILKTYIVLSSYRNTLIHRSND